MKLLRTVALAFFGIALISAAPLFANDFGKVSGIVIDPSGNPQMGAAVWLTPQFAGGRAIELLTDENGIFVGERLRPGLYSVKVTLSGFMPSFRDDVFVGPSHNTSLHIELDSILASIDQLRRKPAKPAQPDDWKWVLRTASVSRPVLQLRDGSVVISNTPSESEDSQPRLNVELTNGSIRPGATSALPGYMGTAVSYDQPLRGTGKLLMAGEVDYDQAVPGVLGGAVATMWIPSGQFGAGPETTLIVHQIKLGDSGRSLRKMRFEHSEQLNFGDRAVLEYGGEYLSGGLVGATTSSVRPHARLGLSLSPRWGAAFLIETDPDAYGLRAQGSTSDPAIQALQTGPTIVWGGGRPILNGGWHEEIAVHRDVGDRGQVEGAVFREDSSHAPVYAALMQSSDPFSPVGQFPGPFAHDGGSIGNWGARVVYREKVSDSLEIAGIYAWAGALAPDSEVAPLANLGEVLQTRYRHSVAARFTGTVPKVKTQMAASYKWIDGTSVTRQDLYGEASMAIDPYFSVSVRQPLPSFLAVGHWEALAEVRNMLGQGYVSLQTQDGKLLIMPVERSFCGGVSFQF